MVTLIHGFEEVVKILYMKICKTLQYLVNLPELASSFTTKELLRRNFAKSKVKGEHISSALQSSYFSEQFDERKAAAQKAVACFRSAIQKLDGS